LVGRDPSTDLAVLKIDGTGLPVAETGTLDRVRAGTIALAVGRSPETGLNASMGVVNAAGPAYRNWRGGRIDRYLRLDLSLYLGASGAAFADAGGLILGLATSALSRVAPIAIPASTIERVVDELLRHGHISRSYLGVGLHQVPLPETLRKGLELSQTAGAIVLSVEAGGPAERTGVVIGDVLVTLAGKSVEDTDDVQAALESISPGASFGVRLIRGGEMVEKTAIAGERPGRRR
jgi:S1-C subfamily serine protease